MKCLILLVFTLGSVIINTNAGKLEEKYVWSKIDYSWSSETQKQNAIRKGTYIPERNMIVGMDIWRDKLFVTVPRWKPGVPSALNYIDLNSNERSPLLHPYPSWAANTLPIDIGNEASTKTQRKGSVPPEPLGGGNVLKYNSTIISPYRIRVDDCNRLWVMDSGVIDIIVKPKILTPPSLLIFDLNTNELIHRYTFPPESYVKSSSFPFIALDVDKDHCDNAYAYLPDVTAFRLVVYSLKKNKSWRIKHNYFFFDPLKGNFFVRDLNYHLPEGIFAMAVGDKRQDGSKDVYFHALSSTMEFVVSNKVLQNESYATSSDSFYEYQLLGDRGENGQASGEAFDKETGVLFYTQINKDAVGCWNTKKPFSTDTQGLVDSDSTTLIFPNDFKVDKDGYLWVLSNRLPLFLFGGINPEDENYRILRATVSNLISGTPCDSV